MIHARVEEMSAVVRPRKLVGSRHHIRKELLCGDNSKINRVAKQSSINYTQPQNHEHKKEGHGKKLVLPFFACFIDAVCHQLAVRTNFNDPNGEICLVAQGVDVENYLQREINEERTLRK
jgi:hypothetical protein